MNTKPKLLFLGKRGDTYVTKAVELLAENFSVDVFVGDWGSALPKEIKQWSGEYIISYLSRWKIPAGVLANAKLAAINFHPAPPEYPGIGCTNFALYEEAQFYGTTCHFMNNEIDSGEILEVVRFPVRPEDSVRQLLARTYEHQFELFKKIVGKLVAQAPLIPSAEKWTRKPYTRKELDELYRISPDMTENEIKKRIRACSFGSWQPYVEVAGHKFRLESVEDLRCQN